MLHTSFADRRSIPHDRDDSRLAAALASGGDRRIRPGADGRNPYFASVLQSDALAYGSSTISSISAHAFAALAARWRHRLDRPLTGSDYAAGLDGLRERIARWAGASDRKSVVEGKRVSVRLGSGGRRYIQKKNTNILH